MIMRSLGKTQMKLCASPEFVANSPDVKNFLDLADLNCFRYRWTPKWIFKHQGKNVEFVPTGSVTSDSGEALMEFAIGGNGVCFVPDFICGQALKDGTLVELLPEYVGQHIAIQAVFPPNRHMPVRVRRLIDFLAVAHS